MAFLRAKLDPSLDPNRRQPSLTFGESGVGQDQMEAIKGKNETFGEFRRIIIVGDQMS